MIKDIIEKKIELVLSSSAGLLSVIINKLDKLMIHELISEILFPVLAAVISFYVLRFLKKYHAKEDNNEPIKNSES